jgi:CHASE2 domain-containing sensor protein
MVGFGMSVIAAVALSATGRSLWAWGVLASACWAFLNSYFLFRLLDISMQAHIEKRNDKILLLSVLKFPVLYMAGFFILKSRFFPILSILAGLAFFVAALVLVWVRSNFNSKRLERTVP